MKTTIEEGREDAAKASCGTSADAIYNLVARKAQDLHVSGTVLDFGAGTGNFARILCEDQSISKVVASDIIDYGSNYQHTKLDWVFHDLNYDIALESESMDAIFAVEMIEHLENPRHLAREWFRVLKPGGALLITTPNNENWRSLFSLIWKHHFHAFTGNSYPAHITALLRLDLERVLTEAGFQSVEFHFTNHGSLPRLTQISWQAISGGFLKGLRYSDNVLCIARKPSARGLE